MTGLTAMAGTTAQSLGTNGAIPTFDDFADAITTLEAANVRREDVVAYMAQRTWSTFRQIKDADGRDLTNTVPTADAPASLFGVPVWATTNIPIDQTQGTDTASSTIVLLDRSQVVVGRRKQVEIAYSEHFAFDADQTAIRLVARYDIQAINPAAIVKIIGVTASPQPLL
jgi:HK97 family phage major capsid protein